MSERENKEERPNKNIGEPMGTLHEQWSSTVQLGD